MNNYFQEHKWTKVNFCFFIFIFPVRNLDLVAYIQLKQIFNIMLRTILLVLIQYETLSSLLKISEFLCQSIQLSMPYCTKSSQFVQLSFDFKISLSLDDKVSLPSLQNHQVKWELYKHMQMSAIQLGLKTE